MQAPRVRLFLSDLLILEVAVLFPPAVLAHLRRVVAPEVGGRGARACRVFPLGLGGQAVKVAGLRAQPLAIFVRHVLRHRDRRVAVRAHAEAHLDVRLRRVRDGVGQLVQFGREVLRYARLFLLLGIHEELEFIPRHLALLHPERCNLHFALRAFVRAAALLVFGAAHLEFPAGNRHHVEAHFRPENRRGVGLHLGLGLFLRVFADALCDLRDHERFRRVVHLRFFLTRDQSHAIGPLRAFVDPRFECLGLCLRQARARSLFDLRRRWHELVVVVGKLGGRVHFALRCVAGDDSFSADGFRFGVEQGRVIFFHVRGFRIVAAHAVEFEDRLHVLHEVHRGGGERGDGDHNGEDGGSRAFHERGVGECGRIRAGFISCDKKGTHCMSERCGWINTISRRYPVLSES